MDWIHGWGWTGTGRTFSAKLNSEQTACLGSGGEMTWVLGLGTMNSSDLNFLCRQWMQQIQGLCSNQAFTTVIKTRKLWFWIWLKGYEYSSFASTLDKLPCMYSWHVYVLREYCQVWYTDFSINCKLWWECQSLWYLMQKSFNIFTC